LVLSLFAGFCTAGEIGTLAVNAVVLSRSNCRFANGPPMVLPFGALDPGNPVDVTRNATAWFVCRGSAPIATFAFSDDGGRYETGPDARRMRHASLPAEYIPYDLTFSPPSGSVPRNVWRILTVTGTVRGTDYAGAAAGSYSDSVVVTILP
jgi:spore coat protein U-like protein